MFSSNVTFAVASDNPVWRDYINERTFYSITSKLKTPVYLESPSDNFSCNDGSEEEIGEFYAGWAFVDFYFMPNSKVSKLFQPNWLAIDFRCGSDVEIEDFVAQSWEWSNNRQKAKGHRFVPLKSLRDFAEVYVSTSFGKLSGLVEGSVISGSNVQISGSCKIPGTGKTKKEIAAAETCLWNILFAAKKSIDLQVLKSKPLQPPLEDYQSRLTQIACNNFLSQVNKLLNLNNLRNEVRKKMDKIPSQRNIQGGIWFGDYVAKNPADFQYYESLKAEVNNYTIEINDLLESEKLGSWMDYWIPSGGWEKYMKSSQSSGFLFQAETLACSELFGVEIPVVPIIY
jgi:hypothetical protein